MSRQNRFPIQGFLSIFCTFFLKSSHCWFPLDKICGQRPIEDNLIPRIIGGESAIFGEIPWQAGLKEHRLFGLLKYRKCGAVVIGDKWLLTAAHCTDTWPFSELIAIVGEHRELKPNKDKTRNPSAMTEHDLIQIRKVKRTIVHPKFNPTLLEDDLALLELEKPLRFDMNIQPICLPFRHDNFTLHDGFVSGWGFTKYRKSIYPVISLTCVFKSGSVVLHSM
jgi:secreted trypsin-like serine protease